METLDKCTGRRDRHAIMLKPTLKTIYQTNFSYSIDTSFNASTTDSC